MSYVHAECPNGAEAAKKGIEFWGMVGATFRETDNHLKEFSVQSWYDVYPDSGIVERIYCRGCQNAIVTFVEAKALSDVEGDLSDNQFDPVIVRKEEA